MLSDVRLQSNPNNGICWPSQRWWRGTATVEIERLLPVPQRVLDPTAKIDGLERPPEQLEPAGGRRFVRPKT